MSETMVRTQVYLPRDIYDKLKERTEAEGVTLAQQIREALTRYVVEVPKETAPPILKEDDPIWNIIGMIDSGITDGSVNHDKYIYIRDWDLDEEK